MATAADARAVVELVLEALSEAGLDHKPEIVEWVVQATVHDPLRGLYLLAATEPPGPAPLALAAVEACADLRHGWTGRLTCLYVRPSHRGRGLGAWLLDQTIGAARYHGLNHLECRLDALPEDHGRLLAAAGFRARPVITFAADLHPLYDDGEA